ncbi:MAG TPA: cation-transporting P-type ATPase [Nitrososphaeraceae archaeon]|nr:cation-transporting P-type ATPase [Nitrososphaeraceae archaeon]
MVTTSTSTTTHHGQEFWSLSPTELLQQFNTTQEKGLASEKANRQLSEYGKNLVHSQTKTDSLSSIKLLRNFVTVKTNLRYLLLPSIILN